MFLSLVLHVEELFRDFAFINPTKRWHGFDHFEGLEQTQQFIPSYAGWHEGAFALDGPEYRQTYDEVIDDLSQFDNISLIVEDIHDLTEPMTMRSKRSVLYILMWTFMNPQYQH